MSPPFKKIREKVYSSLFYYIIDLEVCQICYAFHLPIAVRLKIKVVEPRLVGLTAYTFTVLIPVFGIISQHSPFESDIPPSTTGDLVLNP